MNRHGPLAVVLLALAAAGLVLGVGTVEDPGVVLPLSLESLIFLGVTALLLRAEPDRVGRAWLGRIVLLAILARIGAMLIVYLVLSPEFFAPDVGSYRSLGAALYRSWGGMGTAPVHGWQSSYIYLNAVAHGMFGDARYGMAVANLFLGVWTVLGAYLLARECFGEAAGRVTAALVAVFPSLVLWSVLNIRDALATATVTLVALLAVRLLRRVRLGEFLLLLGALVLLSTLRDYMAVLLLGGVVVGYGLALRRGRLLPTLALGVILVLCGVFFLERFEILSPDVLQDPLASAAGLRQGLQQDFRSGLAGSAYGLGYDTSTLAGAIRYLPVGLAFFLFAPFPWDIGSILQAFTLPEVLLWYALVPFTVLGFRRLGADRRSAAFLLVGVLAVVVSSYALVEGNFGTAYRHRSQVLPLFFVFAAQGIRNWGIRRRERARLRAERIQEARAMLTGAPPPGA